MSHTDVIENRGSNLHLLCNVVGSRKTTPSLGDIAERRDRARKGIVSYSNRLTQESYRSLPPHLSASKLVVGGKRAPGPMDWA